jgi:hypothetical protein
MSPNLPKIVPDPHKSPGDFNKLQTPESGSARATSIRNANQTEYFGGGSWREVVSPDGVVCYVSRLWGKKPEQPLRA